MRRVAVLMCAAIVAGCGGATSESTPSTSSGPAPQATNATTTIPATTVITSAPTSPPDTATTSPAEPSGGTSPDSSFVPPTTPTPTTTPTTVPWPADVTVGPPTPDLLDALPSEGIPWETVGPDWLALDFPRPAHYTDPPTLDQRGL